MTVSLGASNQATDNQPVMRDLCTRCLTLAKAYQAKAGDEQPEHFDFDMQYAV